MSDGRALRIGLVLTGGGARAAYQVGVLRSLARAPVICVAVAGVGAGALNGLVIAGSDNLDSACADLEQFWAQAVLSPSSALRIGPIPVAHLGLYLTLLYAGGADPAVDEVLKAGGRGIGRARRARAAAAVQGTKLDLLLQAVELVASSLNVSTDARLNEILSVRVRDAADKINRPFFVSTFQSGDGILDRLKLILQGTGIINPGPPTYLAVHELPPAERLAAVIASATLPFACRPHEVDGAVFVDGSYGGLSSSAGAVPVTPLLGLETLEAVLVVHTDLASPFDATAFNGVPILEIKPTIPSSSAEVGYFWADAGALGRWMDQGERDAEETLNLLFNSLRLERSVRCAHDKAKRAGDALDELD
jgi:NTE family protein